LDGVVYCVGGTHGPSGTKYCFRLNEVENSWERIANLNIGEIACLCLRNKLSARLRTTLKHFRIMLHDVKLQ
jgi:hypothetical protein